MSAGTGVGWKTRGRRIIEIENVCQCQFIESPLRSKELAT